jgi:YD repeat-containing protein
MIDAAGNRTTTLYDAVSNATSTTDARGDVVRAAKIIDDPSIEIIDGSGVS